MAKQFKEATLSLEKLKASINCKLHTAYALEEAAVWLKGQVVEAQGIYDAYLVPTPMELSNLDMVPEERSNQMALRDRCPQRVSQTVPEERRNQKVSQTALAYTGVSREDHKLSSPTDKKLKRCLFLELRDNSVISGKKFTLWNFKNELNKDSFFAPWLS